MLTKENDLNWVDNLQVYKAIIRFEVSSMNTIFYYSKTTHKPFSRERESEREIKGVDWKKWL